MDMDLAQLSALAAALGWASGLRLYLVLFAAGLAGHMGWLDLPPGLQLLQHPAVLAASGVMLLAEFFADKIPGVDLFWDAVHSVIRVPAGAALAAAAFGADGASVSALAGLLGGTLAATSFATKASTRAAVNSSPALVFSPGISLLEEGVVVGALWLAVSYPLAFGIALSIVLVVSTWLLVVLAKYLKAMLSGIAGVFARVF